MTYLQKTLGQNYKWLYLIRYNIMITSTNIFGMLLSSIPLILNSLIVIFVWSKATSSIAIFTYLIIGRIYKSFAESTPEISVALDVIEGRLTSKVLYPKDYFIFRFFSLLGRRVQRNSLEILTFVFTAFIATYFFGPIQNTNLQTILILLLFVPISYFVNNTIGFWAGSLAFFIKDKREFSAVQDAYNTTKVMLYGLIIPLDQLPFASFFSFLPTAYFVHHPMQIYLGKYNFDQTIQAFSGGIIWCFILWIVARTTFKFGLKKNEAVGL
jgi:ABC-2 type transport system permease protein